VVPGGTAFRELRARACGYHRAMPATRSRKFSATGHLLAVVDDPAGAPGILTALAAAGIDSNDEELDLGRGPELDSSDLLRR